MDWHEYIKEKTVEVDEPMGLLGLFMVLQVRVFFRTRNVLQTAKSLRVSSA